MGQQLCDICGNKGDTSWQMILGDNPRGGRAGGVKIFRKNLGEGGGESRNFEVKIKTALYQHKEYLWNN